MKAGTVQTWSPTLVVQVGVFALLIVMCRTCDLTVPQSTVQGYVGHSSLLRCSYSNCNDVVLSWYNSSNSETPILQKINDTVTKCRGGISLEGQADLRISSVTLSDEDTYTCQIKYSNITKSKEISLNVDVAIAPSITSLNINRSPVIENDSITLTCTATGVPTPSYGWKVNGSTIGHQGRYLHFPSISRTDSGTYRCLASNIQGNAARDKSVDVYYLPGSPWPTCELTTSTTKGYIQEGDDVEITCRESGGNPSPGLQWFNDSSSLTVVYYGLAEFGWTLTSHDNGIKYRCDGNHPAESPTRHCYTDILDVKYSPMLPICDDSGQSPYSEGDTVQITCQSMDGNPLANLRWFNSSESNPMKETTPPYLGHAVNQYSWTVSRADNRLSFDCQATNLVRTTPLTCTTSEFQVNFASNQADLEGYTAPLTTGDNLNLMCTSGSSNPESEIMWYRDDDVIGDSSSETIGEEVTEDGEFYGYVTTQNLTVDVQAKHNGVRYHCGTRNQMLSLNGRTSANSTFVIMEVYFPPNQPEDCATSVTGWLDYVVEGESLDLGCISCSANPAADVVWYRDGVLLTPDEVEFTDGIYNGQRTMGHLEKEISFSDHGAEYSCEASSPGRFPNHIYQSQKLTLNVHYTPRIINDYDTNSTRINAGDSVILWCNISSNPRANITWLDQNGKIITNLTANRLIHERWHDSQMMNSLRIRDVNSDVTGFYTCQVNNSVGGAEFTVYIEVIVESNTIALIISLSVTLFAILLVVVILVFCKKRRGKQKNIGKCVA
ncbi:V-set and immunoglobulin domain-containing protein 10-like [Ptychodera flava]|uniref:V-set and immunoglobulin domain-containing protein 10-like n=1 Tax=Ptychodera flava TaxID=63121 RepID=UPI00396A2D31